MNPILFLQKRDRYLSDKICFEVFLIEQNWFCVCFEFVNNSITRTNILTYIYTVSVIPLLTVITSSAI